MSELWGHVLLLHTKNTPPTAAASPELRDWFSADKLRHATGLSTEGHEKLGNHTRRRVGKLARNLV